MKLRITVEGKVYEVDVEVVGEEGGAGPLPQTTRVASPPPVRPQQSSAPAPAPQAAAASAPSGAKVFPAPLAGTVRAISVKPGDSVVTDQELMVLEAMKMETAVSAVSAGVVKAILVNVGDAVRSGQTLVEFE